MDIDAIGSKLKRNRCDEYHDDGVHLYGKLVVIDFNDLAVGNIDLIEARIQAEAWARECYGKFDRLSCHPKLVIKLAD